MSPLVVRPTPRRPAYHALTLLVAALLLSACAPRTDFRSTELLGEIDPMTFEVVPGRTHIGRFDPPGAGGQFELTMGVQAKNPNPFGVVLESVSYRVFLEGREVDKGAVLIDTYLEAGATVPVTFDLQASLSNQPALLKAAVHAFANEPMSFRVDGTITFSTATHSYETRERTLFSGGALARQSVEPPILRVDERASRVFELQADVPVVQVALKVANTGDVGYFLSGRGLVLLLGGFEVAREDMSPVPMAAGQAGRIDMLFYPDASALSEDALTVLQAALEGYTTLVRVEGELSMDVLGVDSFLVPPGWSVTGFILGDGS